MRQKFLDCPRRPPWARFGRPRRCWRRRSCVAREHRRWRLQPDDGALLQTSAIFFAENDAAAGRNDVLFEPAEFVEQCCFTPRKPASPSSAKIWRMVRPAQFFQPGIGVDPTPAKLVAEEPRDRRFAAAIADQENNAPFCQAAPSPLACGFAFLPPRKSALTVRH